MNTKNPAKRSFYRISVLEAGLEPAQPQWPRDFKSLVSTIPPFEHLIALKPGIRPQR